MTHEPYDAIDRALLRAMDIARRAVAIGVFALAILGAAVIRGWLT